MNKIHLRYKLLTIVLMISNFVFAQQQDTLSFLQITDTHLMFNLENYDSKVVHHREETKGYKNANSNFKEFFQTVPLKTKSDFVIITGDIIDFHDARTNNGKVLAFQVEAFASLLDSLHIPTYLTLGNHDMFSYEWGEDKVIPNQYKTGKARATWTRNFDVFREGNYYSRIFQVGKTTYRLIFLDDSFYKFDEGEEEIIPPYIDKPQLHWLKTQLEESDTDVEIILMHVPFTEESIEASSNNELYSLLSKSPSTKLILAGHRHRDAIMDIPQTTSALIQVETDALVKDINHWRFIQLMENKITVSSMGSTKQEVVISLE